MIERRSVGEWVFTVANYLLLTVAALTCILPFLNVFALSLSSAASAATGKVVFMPIDLDFSAYKFILQSEKFLRSATISVIRVVLGVTINIVLIVLTAYPLSKSNNTFKSRSIYAWFFFFTMLFVPSLIPSYLVVKGLGLIDTIWALVLPGALPVFSMVIMLNFFRGLPVELEEAASIDGANHIKTLLRIYLPLSLPSIATVMLFCIVGHWNAWFDGIIYMNRPEHYPLQSYLQTIVISPEAIIRNSNPTEEMARLMQMLSNKTAKAAQLFVAMVPVLIVYPFLQKHFTKGLVVGSVKG